MSARTPGPWQINGSQVTSLATNEFVADCDSGPYDDNSEANAQFIVTACNNHDALVAALRGALGVLNAMPAPDMNLITLRDNCRAALAKVSP